MHKSNITPKVTTGTDMNDQTSANLNPVCDIRSSRRCLRMRRALAGVLLATAVCGGALAVTATPASATGTVGGFGAATCGWYLQPSPAGGFVDYKITQTNLPAVTGTTTTPQLVWLHVQFVHPGTNGLYEYRGYWLSQYVRSGVWSSYWTDYATGVTHVNAIHDTAGSFESGYTGAEFSSLDTMVILSAYWQTGNVTTGSLSAWALAPRNANNGIVCNGGANFA